VTDRTVVYRLRAEASQFKAQMASVAATTRKTGVDLGTSIKGGASKASSALDDLGINAGTVALAVGTSVVVATANFEKAMSGVQAATHETTSNMNALREAALEAGASTSFSATEAAAGIENLAKAGLSTQDILSGGLDGALDLAAAGSMEVADAAEAAAGAMAQFKLEGDQATHVADLLAAGAGKAQGDVSDMVMALKQAGTVSAQTGLSLEETVAALSAMAEQSLLGSDAGTSFKTMLAALTPNSKKAADAMEQYNINAFDAQGNFVGMTELAGQLQAGLSGLTDEQRAMALETIFGSDAVRAASIIYDNGAEGIANWTTKVDDAGYAAETAAIQMDNLKGDVEQLKGALETAFIEGGDDSQGMLRGLTQAATDAVNLATETEKADGALGGLWDSAMGAVNPLGSLGAAYNGLKGEISGTDEKAKDLDSTSKALTETTSGGVGSTSALASATQGLGGAFEDTAAAIEAAEQAAEDFKDLMDSLNAVLGGRADLRDYEAAIDDFTKKLKENGNTFDTNTKKGRDNQAMLDNIAGSALAVAENMSQADRRKFLTGAIEDLRTMGREMKLPKSEVRALIELLREAHNADVNPKIDVDTTQSLSKIQAVRNSIEALRDRNLTITTTYKVVRNAGDALPYRGEADGGYIAGPGTATSDSIPAYLSNGEYVIKAAAVDKYGIHMFDRLNAMHFAQGGSADRKKRRRSTVEFDSAVDNSPSEAALAQAAEAAEAFYAEQERAQRKAGQRAEAVLEGQQRAWDMATDAAQAQIDAAQTMADSVQQSMDRIGEAATSAFSGSWFTGGQDRGLWTGGGAGDWRSRAESDIAGLQERSSLISQLSGLGLTGAALEDLLGNQSNRGIAAMIQAGEIDDFAAFFAQREALVTTVQQQAGQAGYGADMAAANAQLAHMNAQFAALTAAIEAARPITVLEAISAQETARELARLMAMAGSS
jgi:TP901 family phage tail tape measure protein